MILPTSLWILLAVALVVSSIGFYKYVYFISLGYGFSIAALGVAMLIVFREGLSAGTIVGCILLIFYGIRLGGYLLYREVQSNSYNSKMKTEIKDGKTMGFGVKCAIWITCALLYVLQVSPMFYRLINSSGTDLWCWIGEAVMLFGVLFESMADLQKQKAKEKNPKRFCDTGLYRIVRCPNYLGEMLFWTGMLITGMPILQGAQWIPALIGYLGIIFVMFSGARRLELRQNRTYGDDPEYQNYAKTVPIMVPFVPLYSVAKYKFLVG